MAGALIVTAELAPNDHRWLDRLRRTHYPPERNQLPAHLTMFHSLPPSAEGEVRVTISRLSAERPPVAFINGLIDLGTGVAFKISSNDLHRIRGELAENFRGLLTAQDAAGWRPHVTIQNKVTAKHSRALKAALERDFLCKQPLSITGLALHRYLGGPWERLGMFRFRGL